MELHCLQPLDLIYKWYGISVTIIANRQRLKQIKDFHRTRPEDVSKPLSYEFEQMNLAVKQNEDLPNMVEFSDEEGYGRFLDLHEHYQRYVNIKGASHYRMLQN